MSDATGTGDPTESVTGPPEPERHHGALVTWSHGQKVLHVERDAYFAVITALHDEGYVMAADLCAADYYRQPVRDVPPGVRSERFEVVVNLLAMTPPGRVRVRVQVPESDPVVASLFMLYPGTEAMEREAYDLFGIRFADHPDLTRILMPEDWEGHPLRKDYATGKVPVQFKAASPNR